MLAPVVIFVYNRPEHTKRTIEALSKNRLADQSEVYIFSDDSKNENSIEKVKQVRDYIHSIGNSNIFASLDIKEAAGNKGLANSVISGITEIINKYGKVIVLEDDIVSSPDFLEYMNDALEYYRDNKQIWSISGYIFNMKIPKDYTSDVCFSYRGCSWGYATWEDRWNIVDWDVSDYAEFAKSSKRRKRFNRGGRDMSDMLDRQMAGELDSWAVRWYYEQSKHDMLTVYPVQSRIMNIGIDGTGTHSGNNSRYNVTLQSGDDKCVFQKPMLNKSINRSFHNYFMPLKNYFKLEFKWRFVALSKYYNSIFNTR